MDRSAALLRHSYPDVFVRPAGLYATKGALTSRVLGLSAHWRCGDSKQSNNKDYQSTQSNFPKDVPKQ